MIAAPATRGYAPLYRPAQTCPGCGRGHWLVGRRSAECASCGTAIPLAPALDRDVQIETPAAPRRRWLQW